mmetsp:Transcript_16225/g.26459  ORF Transcript_16225/g.26459 Transcript_16225/m.26459 type:complete len:291 (-) Transcript_16225:1234-2106(-)|eukprot:CAMPEP_0203774218 /NCGR_PEP_ID=MMETSP0099_2-20121227/5162_1 /ASSEMBLY_ACC=CAM_ASM_000209 /TAXON_ID=96639 /ORGANISM=" , Strain NY0313808BC1" /LENGTH=290 /DNA_ID=CAMNT_0050672277 /DNA_START=376 /DNA_END=1248 /DNA_ORIENTATION=+
MTERVGTVHRHLSANVCGGCEERGMSKGDVGVMAQHFVDAWDDKRLRVDAEALPVPSDLASVYALHDAIEERGARCRGGVLGYKLGGIHAAKDERGVPCVAVYAPIFAETIVQEGTVVSAGDLNIFALEAEIGFVLGKDLRVEDAPYSLEDVRAAVGYACLSLELVGTRFRDFSKAERMQSLGDSLCAGGVVNSTRRFSLDEIDASIPTLTRITVNGEEVCCGSTEECPLGNPVLALHWCANDLARRGKSLPKNFLVITGKTCCTESFSPLDEIRVEFGGLGFLETRLKI